MKESDWHEGTNPDSQTGAPTDSDFDPIRVPCVNCETTFEPMRPVTVYCSEYCQQTAAFVRFWRRHKEDGTFDQAEIQEVLLIKFMMLTIGGYPVQERRLSRAARDAAFARDGGACQICGAPATEIDHIGAPIDGDINHPDNLQGLCTSCHREKTVASFIVITPNSNPEARARNAALIAALEPRCEALAPLRQCDDHQSWPRIQDEMRLDRQHLAYRRWRRIGRGRISFIEFQRRAQARAQHQSE